MSEELELPGRWHIRCDPCHMWADGPYGPCVTLGVKHKDENDDHTVRLWRHGKGKATAVELERPVG